MLLHDILHSTHNLDGINRFVGFILARLDNLNGEETRSDFGSGIGRICSRLALNRRSVVIRINLLRIGNRNELTICTELRFARIIGKREHPLRNAGNENLGIEVRDLRIVRQIGQHNLRLGNGRSNIALRQNNLRCLRHGSGRLVRLRYLRGTANEHGHNGHYRNNNHRLLHCNRTSNCFVTYMTIHTAARF